MKIPYGKNKPNDNDAALLSELGFDLNKIDLQGNYYFLTVPEHLKVEHNSDRGKDNYNIFLKDTKVISIQYRTTYIGYTDVMHFAILVNNVEHAKAARVEAKISDLKTASMLKSLKITPDLKATNKSSEVEEEFNKIVSELANPKLSVERIKLLKTRLAELNPKVPLNLWKDMIVVLNSMIRVVALEHFTSPEEQSKAIKAMLANATGYLGRLASCIPEPVSRELILDLLDILEKPDLHEEIPKFIIYLFSRFGKSIPVDLRSDVMHLSTNKHNDYESADYLYQLYANEDLLNSIKTFPLMDKIIIASLSIAEHGDIQAFQFVRPFLMTLHKIPDAGSSELREQAKKRITALPYKGDNDYEALNAEWSKVSFRERIAKNVTLGNAAVLGGIVAGGALTAGTGYLAAGLFAGGGVTKIGVEGAQHLGANCRRRLI